MLPVQVVVNFRERRQFPAQHLQIEQARLESVVEIGRVVSTSSTLSISCASRGGCKSRSYSANSGNAAAIPRAL